MSTGKNHVNRWPLVLLALPLPALAHGSIPGAGAFFNGLAHPFLAPAHAISLLALGLWIGGQGGSSTKGRSMGGLLLGLLAGAALARALGDPSTDTALLLLALTCSIMVALQWTGPPWWAPVVAFALGTAVALGSGDPSLRGVSRLSSLAAGCIGAALLAANVAWLVDELVVRRHLQPVRVAVRIISAWLSAIALMLLALAAK